MTSKPGGRHKAARENGPRARASRLPLRAYLFLSRLRGGMTLGVRGAVFDPEGRVFLVRHSYVPGWYFPGGGVEAGEAAIDALRRELMEEAAIRLEPPADLFGLYLNRTLSKRDHVAFFVCRSWSQVGPPVRNMEIVDSGFFPPDDLPRGTTAGTRRRLAEIAAGAPGSAEW